MAFSRELLLCVALSALTSSILFLYFRTKFAVVENKVMSTLNDITSIVNELDVFHEYKNN